MPKINVKVTASVEEIESLATDLIISLQEQCHSGDTESDHGLADDLLAEFFRDIGLTDVADTYESVDKWYA